MKSFPPGTRQRQVLRLLAEHGPLSIRSLQKLLNPPLKRGRIKELLKNMKKGGLVSKKHEKIFSDRGFFYHIPNSAHAKAVISEMISVPEAALQGLDFRYVELLHSEQCALWAESMKALFPNARVIRDHHFLGNPDLMRRLLLDPNDMELRPDIILFFPKKETRERVTVAIEIERTQKTDERIRLKLKKYAKRTRLDGLVYLSAREAITDRVHLIYQSKILSQTERVDHYGKNFFLFGGATATVMDGDLSLLNAARETIQLKNWMEILLNTPESKRRDKAFANPLPMGGAISRVL